jgi:GNAT superfamily N-acetyltransferase
MLEVTPCVDELDELASLDIYNSVWPYDAVTIEAAHSFRDSAQDYIDYLVREDGVILGSGVGAIFGYRPHRIISLISVSATHRKRGAGTALYEALSIWAGERGVRELEVSVSDSDPESLAFARRRDFIEERRQVSLVLKLAGISPSQVTPPAGIKIVTWAQRPELARGMHAVAVETRPDIPGFEDVAVESFEEWMAHLMQRPTDSPEATFIALADEEVVGFAKLSLTAPTAAGNSMTAVKRAWRGRGIARALKATEINWALANGYIELHTSNEERNTPINRLNARLGYRPGDATIYLVGPIVDGTRPIRRTPPHSTPPPEIGRSRS